MYPSLSTLDFESPTFFYSDSSTGTVFFKESFHPFKTSPYPQPTETVPFTP